MRNRVCFCLIVAASWGGGAWGQTRTSWPQLPLDTCGVDEFLAAHSEADGRGVVIAILDTGVDPSIPGLTRTPEGEVKVIDVQDFSGEGDTDLHRVRFDDREGAVVEYDDDGAPLHYTLPELPAAADGEERRFWFGWLEEKKFINSEVPDLNDNGRTDDRFALCVTALAGDGDDEALCFFDTNMDRNFADEKRLRSYRLNYDTFTLTRAQPEKQIEPVTFAINIFLRQSKVVIHFDDGAHGTHVAGIAAGYRINNQDGFNGVAPGAKVISLKIGQNGVGSPSTTDSKKRAMEYAARFAREHGVPVVCNLSYGVESTIEGSSDVDKFMNEHLRKNPHLIFCTSAGNEGPGLSTMGTPSAAAEAISVGALLAPGPGRNMQGYHIDRPVVTVFSSRGGELAKPDIATPGWATSTVPRWVKGRDYWAGTSMASPHAAGLCALLVSDAMARHPGAAVRAGDVKRALQLSASAPAGTTPLDVGYGIPDVAEASRILDRLLAAAQDDPVISYEISTPCPHGYKGRAGAAYWRGTYFPSEERQEFTIAPVFAPGVDASARTSFTRRFELRSQAPWCKLPQTTFYLRSEMRARVYVEYDAAQLAEAGLHVGVVEALHGGEVAFRLLNTVVVPYRFGPAENFTRRFEDLTATGWRPQRFFLAVPPGASAMRLVLSAPEGESSKASIERIFDPHGFQLRRRGNRLDSDAGKREVVWSVTDDLVPGVWEVDLVADRPDREWPCNLKARFFGLHADPAKITACDSATKKPAGELTVTNLFERPLQGVGDGRIEGFRKHSEDTFEGLKDELSYTIKLGADYRAVRLALEMTPEAWAETTDIAVAVEDATGEAVYSSAFDNNTFSATVNNPTPGEAATLTLKIRAGFAVSDDQRRTPLTVNIDHLLAEAIPLEVTRDESSNVDFVPGVPIKLAFEAVDELPKAPEETNAVGYLRFRERHSNEEALRVLLHLID